MSRINDSYTETFDGYASMYKYHCDQNEQSKWISTDVKKLQVSPLDKISPLYTNRTVFDSVVSDMAIEDTSENLGLALKVGDQFYPLRDTAYKSLLDRAKISGTALPKLSRNRLADTLNCCLMVHDKAQALILIRDEKVAAVHSGDKRDYSTLPIHELMAALHETLEESFPGAIFKNGYCDHSIVCATFELPEQADELLETYKKVLDSTGRSVLAKKLQPAIRFQTSDVGISTAKVSAFLSGYQTAISIGSMIGVEHRRESKVEDFKVELARIYAQYQNYIEKLMKLTDIDLDYPVNAMIAACKKLALPKKAAVEAIHMFEVSWGNDRGSAHDVFLALQEIMYLLQADGFPARKLFETEEKLAGSVSLKWSDFDTPKAVSYI